MCGKRKGPDWTKTGTIVAYADWLRSKSEALVVIIVRRDDAAISADSFIAPKDVRELVSERVIELALSLEEERKEKRNAARLTLGKWNE